MTSYYDWINRQQTCPDCGWIELGSKAAIGDTFDHGVEYHCPKCQYRFGFIAYPLIKESLTDPRAPDTDRMFAEIVIDRLKKKTNDPAQN